MRGVERFTAVPLSELTTFGIGGPAAQVLRVECDDSCVQEALAECRGLPMFVLGSGSNVLVADAGYDGTVLLMRAKGRADRVGSQQVDVDATRLLDDLVTACGEWHLQGIECLAGIPGTVGGAVVQNAGAYDQQIADVITSVTCVDRSNGKAVVLPLDQCSFSYRESIFAREPDRYVIIRAHLELEGSPTCVIRRKDVLAELDRLGVPSARVELERLGAPRAPVDLDRLGAPGARVEEDLERLGVPGARVEEDLERLRVPGACVDLDQAAGAVRSLRARKDHLIGPTIRTAGSFFKNFRTQSDGQLHGSVCRLFAERKSELLRRGQDWVSEWTADRPGHEDLIAGSLIGTSCDIDARPDEFRPGAYHGPLRLGRGGPNTIINLGTARAVDVLDLARRMRSAVRRTYGVVLQPEVTFLGDISL